MYVCGELTFSNQSVYDWRQQAATRRHHFLNGWGLIRQERLADRERTGERLLDKESKGLHVNCCSFALLFWGDIGFSFACKIIIK